MYFLVIKTFISESVAADVESVAADGESVASLHADPVEARAASPGPHFEFTG